jgi:dTDP-4-amino-4,6-dideoxygalactose transaminase
MNLIYKKPSKETKKAIFKAISNSDKDIENSYFKEAEDKITTITSHNHSKLVNSGNSAIMIAVNHSKGPILIPDQGGWNGVKQIANFLKKETIIFKTNQGLVSTDYIDEAISTDEFKNLEDNYKEPATLFLSSFAGYTAEQPIKEISKWCDEKGILLVEDASGGITDPKKLLSNGKYSDIIVCSTGSPKIVNVGYGGFISSNNPKLFEESKLLLKTFKVNSAIAKGIATELDFGEHGFKTAIKACEYLKNNLPNVIHQDKRGINIIISNKNPKKLSMKLRNEFYLEGRSIITRCPNYNRLKEKGIAIEIKNLANESLTKDNLDSIINIISKNINSFS